MTDDCANAEQRWSTLFEQGRMLGLSAEQVQLWPRELCRLVADAKAQLPRTSLLRRCLLNLPQAVTQRLAPYVAVERGLIRLDGCNLDTAFPLLVLPERTGGISNSFIMYGRLLGKQYVVIKLALLRRDANQDAANNSLQVEREIYEKIINSLILCGYTPHVVSYIGTLACDSFAQTTSPAWRQLQQQLRVPHISTIYDTKRIRAMVTEHADGNKLTTILQSIGPTQANFNEFAAVLFQLFFTLQVFAEVGLAHNDLHSDNVMVVEATEQPETNYYQVVDKIYRVTTRMQVHIFDFDRSAKLATTFDDTQIINNELVGHCARFGQCNAINTNVELYVLAASIFAVAKSNNPMLHRFIIDVVPEDLLTRPSAQNVVNAVPGSTLVWPGRLCTCNEEWCATCSIVRDPRIKSYKEILTMREFDQFVVNNLPAGSFIWRLPSQASTETWKALVK